MSFYPSPNIFSCLQSRSISNSNLLCSSYIYNNLSLSTCLIPHESSICNMQLTSKLEGHSGCVNRLEYNSSYSLLASGSDDCDVRIWSINNENCMEDYEENVEERKTRKQRKKNKCKVVVNTGHTRNIFGVGFLENDQSIASCGMDCEVRLVRIEFPTEPVHVWSCHSSRVKDIAVIFSEPELFYTCGEDGAIRQFDLRDSHVCSNSGECNNILANFSRRLPLKSLSINPINPNIFAVAADDQYIRILDRRYVNNGSTVTNNTIHNDKNCIALLAAEELTESNHSTFVSFDQNGSQLAASYHGSHVFVYDTIDSESKLKFNIEQNLKQWKDENEFHTDTPDRKQYDRYNMNKTSNSLDNTEQAMSTFVSDLKTKGNQAFKASEFDLAVSLYNLAISKQKPGENHSVLYSNRAAALLKRNYAGDDLLALKDCKQSLRIQPNNNTKAMYRKIQALKQLEKFKRAKKWAEYSKTKWPNSDEFNQILNEINSEINEKQKKHNTRKTTRTSSKKSAEKEKRHNEKRTQLQLRRLHRIKKLKLDIKNANTNHDDIDSNNFNTIDNNNNNNNNNHDEKENVTRSLRKKRKSISTNTKQSEETAKLNENIDDTDINIFDEDNLDSDNYSTVSSLTDTEEEYQDDEKNDKNPSNLDKSNNDTCNYSMEDDFISNINNNNNNNNNTNTNKINSRNNELTMPCSPIDYSDFYRNKRYRHGYYERLLGSANILTDIKEATFYGNYVLSGSDDGSIFVWDRYSGRLVNILTGSEEVVNCVRGNPLYPLIVSSGIDNHINVWSPCSISDSNNNNNNNNIILEEKDTVSFESSIKKMHEFHDKLSNNQRRINDNNESGDSGGFFRIDSDILLALLMRHYGAQLTTTTTARRRGRTGQTETEQEESDEQQTQDNEETEHGSDEDSQ